MENSNWFITLFAAIGIDQSNSYYFDSGFLKVTRKLLKASNDQALIMD